MDYDIIDIVSTVEFSFVPCVVMTGEKSRKEVKEMIMKAVMCVVLCAAATGLSAAAGGNSASALVRQHPSSSLLWKTVTSPRMDVMLDWPEGAVKAVVTVDGAVRATVTDPLVASAEISFDLPASEAEERMITLAAAYLDGEETVLDESEVMLALVRGVGSRAFRCRAEDGREWGKANAKSAVLPIPENAATLTVGGETVLDSPSAPGWYWWKRVPSVSTALALALDDGSVYENSVCGLTGFTIILK